MNIYVTGLVWVSAAMAAGAGIAFLVRRFGLDEGRPDNNEAAGQVFMIVGGLHAVLLSFVLISLFDAVTQAGESADKEAGGLVAVSWAAQAFPEPARERVREAAVRYARTVADREWPQLEKHGEVTGPGWRQLDRLRAAVADAAIDTDNEWQAGRKAEAETRLLEVYTERQVRVGGSQERELGPVVWFVLALGGFITVVLSNLFGGTKLLTHIVIVTTLAGMTTLLMYAIFQLQNPFAADVKLTPDAFRLALDRLG